SEELQLAMRRIAEQAERAGKVIKSVHDVVRRRERVREAVPPRALLDAIMPLVSLQARKLGVRVAVELAEACEPVLCDRTMVAQHGGFLGFEAAQPHGTIFSFTLPVAQQAQDGQDAPHAQDEQPMI